MDNKGQIHLLIMGCIFILIIVIFGALLVGSSIYTQYISDGYKDGYYLHDKTIYKTTHQYFISNNANPISGYTDKEYQYSFGYLMGYRDYSYDIQDKYENDMKEAIHNISKYKE